MKLTKVAIIVLIATLAMVQVGVLYVGAQMASFERCYGVLTAESQVFIFPDSVTWTALNQTVYGFTFVGPDDESRAVVSVDVHNIEIDPGSVASLAVVLDGVSYEAEMRWADTWTLYYAAEVPELAAGKHSGAIEVTYNTIGNYSVTSTIDFLHPGELNSTS